MTKKTTNGQFAAKPVADFLRTATKGQRCWYLSRGEPDCIEGQFLTEKGFESKLFPGLRGVRVGDAVKTRGEAIRQAAEVRKNLLALTDLEPFDEEAVGVTGEDTLIASRFVGSGVRLEKIIHVGAMVGDEGCEELREMIEDLDAEHPDKLFDDLPWIGRMLAPEKDIEGEGDGDEESRTARQRDDDLVDRFSMMAGDEGTMGFIVQASVPLHEPHADGNGASVRLGTRYLQWRYGPTFKIACDRAIEWGEQRIEAMMAKKAA